MNRTAWTSVSIGLGCFFLISCSTARDSVVDHVAGFPASHVVSDVASTSGEYAKEKQEGRVEELSQDYEEFLKSQESDEPEEEETKQSVIIKQHDRQRD